MPSSLTQRQATYRPPVASLFNTLSPSTSHDVVNVSDFRYTRLHILSTLFIHTLPDLCDRMFVSDISLFFSCHSEHSCLCISICILLSSSQNQKKKIHKHECSE